MSENKKWRFELDEYIRQGEPDQIEKSAAWQAAIGLQAVDGLKISEYLLDTAKNHIEGKNRETTWRKDVSVFAGRMVINSSTSV